LQELPCRYGDMIDDRDGEGLRQIFLEDATFEIPDQVLSGLPEIRAFMHKVRTLAPPETERPASARHDRCLPDREMWRTKGWTSPRDAAGGPQLSATSI
jgi:hypothetical protein